MTTNKIVVLTTYKGIKLGDVIDGETVRQIDSEPARVGLGFDHSGEMGPLVPSDTPVIVWREDHARHAEYMAALHTKAIAEFDRARLADQGYNLRRTGPDSVDTVSTASLGRLLTGELNGWVAAVIRDELHSRAVEQE